MRPRRFRSLLTLTLISCATLRAEDGSQAWLRYAPPSPHAIAAAQREMPAVIVTLDPSLVAASAEAEIRRGVQSMLGRTLRVEVKIPNEDAWILGTKDELREALPDYRAPSLGPEGFALTVLYEHGHHHWLIAGADARGILYGSFRTLSGIARGESFADISGSDAPAAPIRWMNQWDNLDGTIERGYAGRSIFFDNGSVRTDLTRAGAYARLLASVGINGCTINNVNADPHLLQPEMIRAVARIADAFRPWGVRLSISVAINSPQAIGGLDTFDPGDAKVAAWWRAKVDEIYVAIPDFAGFVVKADSEGEPGPSRYGRTPADAANLLARALQPHGGVVLYRAFVYNHHLDWNDPKADRACAAYDIFHPLDGQFAGNVIVQIKNGPIDFQVREPVSPLFAGLRKTNEAFELQITQEYMGQQRHLVFLPTQWKSYFDFDLRVDNRSTPLKDIVDRKTFHRPLGGYVGVANVGLDTNWLAHPLAMANLYGFARLAWNPNTSAETIAEDWTRLTFGNDAKVVSTITHMLLSSWPIYEDYTGPLGLQTLTNITGPHYGPAPQSQENNGWGQWIRADHNGVGMDRTVATGTGFISQYPPQVAAMFTSLKTCPDTLLLFMHHVPYTYGCTPARPSSRPSTISTTRAHSRLQASSNNGKPCIASSTPTATTRPSPCSNTRPATPSSGATPSTAGSQKSPASPTIAIASTTTPTASPLRKCCSMATRPSMSRRGRLLPVAKPMCAKITPPVWRQRILIVPRDSTISPYSTSITAREHPHFSCFSTTSRSPHGPRTIPSPDKPPTEIHPHATLCMA